MSESLGKKTTSKYPEWICDSVEDSMFKLIDYYLRNSIQKIRTNKELLTAISELRRKASFMAASGEPIPFNEFEDVLKNIGLGALISPISMNYKVLQECDRLTSFYRGLADRLMKYVGLGSGFE